MNIKEIFRNLSMEGKGLYYKLTIVFALFFLVPLTGFFFFVFRYQLLHDEYIPIFIFAVLVFSLFAFSIVRNIFDNISSLAKRVTGAVAMEGQGAQAAGAGKQNATDEIQNIISSFQSLETQLNRQFVSLNQKVSQISTLKELADLCYVTLESDDLLYITLERAMKLVNGDIGSVLILERGKRDYFIVHAAIGHGDKLQSGDRIDFAKSIAKFAVINKAPLLVEDIEKDDRFGRRSKDEYGTKSFLCMPLKGIKDVFGVLTVSRRREDLPFTAADADVLAPLVSNAAFTYDNLSLIKEKSYKDEVLSTVDHIAKIFGSTVAKGELIPSLLAQIGITIPFDIAVILAKESESSSRLSVLEYRTKMDVPFHKGDAYPYEGSLIDKVLQDGNAIILPDLDTAPKLTGLEILVAAAAKAAILAPLKMGGQVHGVLLLGSRAPAGITEAEEKIDMLVSLVSLAIVLERLEASISQREREMDFVKQIGSILASSTFDLNEVIKQTMNMIRALMDVEGGSLLLRQEDHLVFREAFNIHEHVNMELLKNLRLKLGQGIAGYAAARGESLIVANTEGSRYFYPEFDRNSGFQTRSVLAVPLISQGRILGVIEVLNKVSGEFTDSDMKLLQSIATSVSIALENARLYQETKSLAEHERGIRNVFQKFVPKEVVERIIHGSETGEGVMEEIRLLTILNIDLRGFSILSSQFSPNRTVTILNHFFGVIGEIILKHRGIVDKYLGDGLLGIFGAPASSGYDADNAVAAALEMQAAMKGINHHVHTLVDQPLTMGISIHTGEALIGNIGFDKKMDYTVIGDSVNVVFRLQSLTKYKPDSILITEMTHQAVVKSVLQVAPLEVQDEDIAKQINFMRVYELLGQQSRHGYPENA
ncbi:MAG TPA: GAF domain-containing protein [Syntrophales bacterium]|nr:GAF domain-containing protein [Syntrophales bacterium]